MEFDEWAPVYDRIRRDFGYSLAMDEAARDVLFELRPRYPRRRLERLAGSTVAVAGAGRSLESERATAAEADVVIAASTAADRLERIGIDVDLMVTDLDKNPQTAVSLTKHGVPVAIHAHGDNVDLLREWVPRADSRLVLGTTQAEPVGSVVNFGGFTDGDRGAFLADHFGASRLIFPGWDFDDPDVDPEKRLKLRWAERLLFWLERRRNERFAVLDGRRERIDGSWMPR